MLQPRRNSPLTLFKRTLLANGALDGSSIIDAFGSKLFCKTTIQPFRVKLDTGESFEMEDGFSNETENGEVFARLELLNPNAVALDVQLYIGSARIFRAAPIFTREAPTIVAGSTQTIAAASSYYLDPVYAGVGRHRKQLVLHNQGAASVLLYTTNAAHAIGSALMFINAGEKITLFTSDYLRIFNGQATSQIVGITETYYA